MSPELAASANCYEPVTEDAMLCTVSRQCAPRRVEVVWCVLLHYCSTDTKRITKIQAAPVASGGRCCKTSASLIKFSRWSPKEIIDAVISNSNSVPLVTLGHQADIAEWTISRQMVLLTSSLVCPHTHELRSYYHTTKHCSCCHNTWRLNTQHSCRTWHSCRFFFVGGMRGSGPCSGACCKLVLIADTHDNIQGSPPGSAYKICNESIHGTLTQFRDVRVG